MQTAVRKSSLGSRSGVAIQLTSCSRPCSMHVQQHCAVRQQHKHCQQQEQLMVCLHSRSSHLTRAGEFTRTNTRPGMYRTSLFRQTGSQGMGAILLASRHATA
jgi:hypothetical protein